MADENLYGDELDEQPDGEPIIGPTDPEDPDDGEDEDVIDDPDITALLNWQDDGGEA
jgi:hypothetical protein